jgi:hypothetical protein
MNWVKKASKVITLALLCSMFAEQVVVASFFSVGGEDGSLVKVGSARVGGERGIVSVGKNDDDLEAEGRADASTGRGRRRFYTRKERQEPYNRGYDSVEKPSKKSNKRRRSEDDGSERSNKRRRMSDED